MDRSKQQQVNLPFGERGSVLVIALLFTVVLSFLGVTFLSISGTDVSIAFNETEHSQAFYLAEAGIADLDAVTRASTKWNLSVDGVTVAIVGCDAVAHLENAVAAVAAPELSEGERAMLDQIERTPTGSEYAASRR